MDDRSEPRKLYGLQNSIKSHRARLYHRACSLEVLLEDKAAYLCSFHLKYNCFQGSEHLLGTRGQLTPVGTRRGSRLLFRNYKL